MKIAVDLLQSTGTKGGIESYVRALYTELGRMKTKHEFVGYAPSEMSSMESFKWFPGEIVKAPYSGEDRLSWATGEVFGVSRFASEIQADLIHAPAMLGPIRSQVPVVLTIHDLSYFTHPKLMRNRLLTPGVKLLEHLAARNAKSIISISESTATLIPKYLGEAAFKKTTVVLSSGGEVEPCTATATKNSGRPTFVAMGQRSPYKDLETAVRAIALIPQPQRPKLVITGSHGDDPLTPLVHMLQLEDDVTLLQWIEETQLRALMCSATALIETTVAAGFGMPAVEALKMGLPVISADIPVFREILGESARFFKPSNEADLALQLTSVMNDSQELVRLKQSGLEQGAKYSWTKTARETLLVFEEAQAGN